MFLSTPIRAGVELFPLEYAYVQQHCASPGVLIGSEFSTYCRVLHGAIYVNPWRVEEIMRGLYDAVAMPLKERRQRAHASIRFVQQSPVGDWALRVLLDLKRARKRDDKYRYIGVGMGLQFRLMASSGMLLTLLFSVACVLWPTPAG